MRKRNSTRAFVRTLTITAALVLTAGACSNATGAEPPQSAQSTPDGKEQPKGADHAGEGTNVPAEPSTDQPTEPSTEQSVELSADEAQSLEQIATGDAEKYMDALKKGDAGALSRLMAHAEDEYVPETMEIVLEGFRLHFDNVADLKLTFESNQQTEEHYVENFVLTGKKQGRERSIPFQVKYAKRDGIEAVWNKDRREPLYDSPLISQYPRAVRDAQRYVQALVQKDADSLAIHMGLDESAKEARIAVKQLLAVYAGKLDAADVKVVPQGYDANKKQFLFELKDGKKRTHSIQLDADTSIVRDDWAALEENADDN